MWVYRPMSLEVTAHCFKHEFPSTAFRNFHGVVHENEANSGINELLELVKVIHHQMPLTSITKDDHTVSTIKRLRISWPTLVKRCFKTEFALLKCIGEQFISTFMGMGRRVLSTISEEYNLLVLRKSRGS